jgi:hypothetical protein
MGRDRRLATAEELRLWTVEELLLEAVELIGFALPAVESRERTAYSVEQHQLERRPRQREQ